MQATAFFDATIKPMPREMSQASVPVFTRLGGCASVDAGGSPRRRIMDQHAKIVGTNAKLMNNESHRFSFSNSGPYIVL
jgi:hypothetical protein